MHDVEKINVVPGRDEHSASFPSRLIEPRICSSCPPGGVVLDPFVGVGTTAEVALATGRRAIGYDINERFLEAAKRRLGSVAKILF